MKEEIELLFDYSSFQDQEAVINQLKHSLSLNKTYIAQLEKSTQLSRSLLKDTLNTKLRYEKIIKKVMKNESKGKMRSIQSVINNTPLENSAQLESLNSVLPQMPTRPVEQKIKQKHSPKKKFTMSSKKLVQMQIFSRRNQDSDEKLMRATTPKASRRTPLQKQASANAIFHQRSFRLQESRSFSLPKSSKMSILPQ